MGYFCKTLFFKYIGQRLTRILLITGQILRSLVYISFLCSHFKIILNYLHLFISPSFSPGAYLLLHNGISMS